jgi:hypothetical protein
MTVTFNSGAYRRREARTISADPVWKIAGAVARASELVKSLVLQVMISGIRGEPHYLGFRKCDLRH